MSADTIAHFTKLLSISIVIGSWIFVVFYGSTAKWWRNPGGRLMMAIASWQAIGFSLAVVAQIRGGSTLMTLFGESLVGELIRLGVTAFVGSIVLYEWLLLIKVRRGEDINEHGKGRIYPEADSEGDNGDPGGDSDVGSNSRV